MPDVTPAQELRAAAERLLEAAADAFGVWAATYVAPEAAAWAHMVSPAIAEPLADLLDDGADWIKHLERMYGDEDAHARGDTQRWLAFARAILAAAPTPSPTGSNPGGET